MELDEFMEPIYHTTYTTYHIQHTIYSTYIAEILTPSPRPCLFVLEGEVLFVDTVVRLSPPPTPPAFFFSDGQCLDYYVVLFGIDIHYY